MADNPGLMIPAAVDRLSSDALAAILGGLVGGIVGGMLSVIAAFGAQYLQHRLRRTGKVRCAVRSFYIGNPAPMVLAFAFPLVFRNEKVVDIAIDELTFTVWHEGKCLVKTPVFEEGTGQIIAYLDRGGTDKVYFDKGLDKFRLHSGCENRIPKQG
jgi:hypothetical protein